MLTTGDRPKLVRCRSYARSVSLVFSVVIHTNQSIADLYIEVDLDPTEKVVRMTCIGALLSSLVIL